MTKVRISRLQLSLLLIGFILGNVSIINSAANAKQDAWLAYLIGWSGGIILIGIYGFIARLNPEKTLIEILKKHFGKYLGSGVAFLYILYFIHLGALMTRSAGNFVLISTYPETPLFLLMLLPGLTVLYQVRKGLEVMGRVDEFFVPIAVIAILILLVFMFPLYDPSNFKPILKDGLQPVLKTSLTVTSFPFGEAVIFLMIFPYINSKKGLIKISIFSVLIAGCILFLSILKDIMVLGGDKFARNVYPSFVSSRLAPGYNLDPLVVAILAIGTGVKGKICIYGTSLGLKQLFNLDNYKLISLQVLLIIVALATWLHPSTVDLLQWKFNIWPYYSIPFQIIIPLYLLISSILKGKD